jgi:hypothetical protein
MVVKWWSAWGHPTLFSWLEGRGGGEPSSSAARTELYTLHTHKISLKTAPCLKPFFSGTTLPILNLNSFLGSLKNALYILISYAF